ncbi:MAG TPA: hypothetical protein VNI79_02400 [Sphingomicrobium sp.]|nr:hypothetical protein [Sphingomicrobium sp.]
MAINHAVERRVLNLADAQPAWIDSSGLASHGHVYALREATGPSASRDLADAVHLLCSLYGGHPGLVELALRQCPAGPVREWMSTAADAFERERLFLLRLTAAVGPMPSTPGSAQTESTLSGQRRAVKALAVSERRGCALGATTALVTDWSSVRSVLAQAAARTGIEIPPSSLPDRADVARILDGLAGDPAAERASTFGAEQLLLQNRGLFDLLEARASARA